MGVRISGLTATTTPADTDTSPLDTTSGTRKVTWANLKTAIFGALNGLTGKSTPVSGDVFLLGDSAASYAGKKITLSELQTAVQPPYAKLSETQTAGTAGGTFTSGAWQTRVINTENSDAAGIVSISSNQFTLQAGTYIIRAVAPAYSVDRHKIKLYNVTDAADTIIGKSFYSASAGQGYGDASLQDRFTISGAKAFEIRHRCATTQASNGLGIESNFGVSEVYTVVEIWKVA